MRGGSVVSCIMHIYAHILAAKDDGSGGEGAGLGRGFRRLRGPYLCKCSHTRVAPSAAFPARYFTDSN